MSEAKKTGRTRTVADAVREAAGREAPGSTSSAGAKGQNGTGDANPGRRAPGPARPAQSSSAQSSTPRKNASKAAGTKSAGTAGSGAQSTPATSPKKKATPPKKTASAPKPGQKPAAGRSTPMTAGDYARDSRPSSPRETEDTAVIPAAREQAERPAAAPAAAGGVGREARLRLTTIEPWSVTRLAFVVSVALMIVSVVAVTIFWVVLDLTGIWDSLNGTITNVLSDNEGAFDLTDYLGLGRLVGLTLMLSAVNVVLMTAIATIAAHLYNLAAQLLGGIQVTFTDK